MSRDEKEERKNKYWVGAHVSAAGGSVEALGRAEQLKATAFAFFTKNQRQWFSPSLTREDIEAFRSAFLKGGWFAEQVLPHDGYLINLAHAGEEEWERSKQSLEEEIKRCHALGLSQLNIHLGSHLKRISEEAAIDRISSAIEQVLDRTKGVAIVLETSAGQGSNLGYRFEQLKGIIEGISDPSRIGVCMDTCHMFASGYDLRTFAACERTFRSFEEEIGFVFLRGMHLNGSKGGLGSRLDRHAPLQEGEMGTSVFSYIMQEERCAHIPLILETPVAANWEKEIAWLRSCIP